MPFFSVIIPTYNRKEHLHKAIESLEKQTYRDFELIIADDGSSDGTEEFVKSFKSNLKIKYHRHENAGRSAARNMGLGYAIGKIVLFIDDHCYADKRLLEEHFNMHQNLRYTKYNIVRGYAPLVSSLDKISTDPKRIDMLSFKFRGEQNPFVSFFTGNVSIDRKALNDVGGFDENFKEYGFQDSELGYRLVKAGNKIKVNPNALVYVVSVGLPFEKRCDKMRQAGHSAVVLLRKNFYLGLYVGVNPINLLLYLLFSFKNNWLLERLYRSRLNKFDPGTKKRIQIENRIRYYYFLIGIWEKLFNTTQLREYYEAKA
jgi:glycosyltransferase involved in cell wall biosynthesis